MQNKKVWLSLALLLTISLFLIGTSAIVQAQDGETTPFTLDWASLGIGAAAGTFAGLIIGIAMQKRREFKGHVTLMK